MIKRIIYSLILFVSAFTLPFWVSVLFGLFGLFYFKNLYEVIFVGIIIDSLYGATYSVFNFEFIFTIFFVIVFYIVTNFKKQIFV